MRDPYVIGDAISAEIWTGDVGRNIGARLAEAAPDAQRLHQLRLRFRDHFQQAEPFRREWITNAAARNLAETHLAAAADAAAEIAPIVGEWGVLGVTFDVTAARLAGQAAAMKEAAAVGADTAGNIDTGFTSNLPKLPRFGLSPWAQVALVVGGLALVALLVAGPELGVQAARTRAAYRRG